MSTQHALGESGLDFISPIGENDKWKWVNSPNYHYIFRKADGLFLRWGKTHEDDPQWSPIGAELADVEISKNGCPKAWSNGTGNGAGNSTSGNPDKPFPSQSCPYCYKSNTTAEPENMSLDTFKTIIRKIGPQLTQVALGLTGVQTNPDLIPIMQHCRNVGVVPNYTLSGVDLTDEIAEATGRLAGAVAVSYHGDWGLCRNTIERMSKAGVKQVNIHAVTTDKETLVELIHQIKMVQGRPDFKLNALVFLSLKPKGRAARMHNISEQDLVEVVNMARVLDIGVGFDSCSAHRALAIYGKEQEQYIEPCESSLFSGFVDVYGMFHPCSFAEGEVEFPQGIYIPGQENFRRDVWMAPEVVQWRDNLLKLGRTCPLFGART